MRLTFPILTLCKGGAQRMLVEIINGLSNRGHDVTIIMPPQGAVEYQVNARLIRSNLPELTVDDYPWADVIVSNFYLTIPIAHAASERGKGIHVRFSLCYEPMFLPDQRVTFPTYQITKHQIVLSDVQKELLFLNHGIKAKKVLVGISSAFSNLYLRSIDKPLQISAIVRLPEGGWSWHRNQDYLVQQLERIKHEYPDVIINLICPPAEFAESATLQYLGKRNLFQIFTPFTDQELNHYYNHTDIFISSSIFEAAQIPGLEAMKCGAALVALYAGGNMEYCHPRRNWLQRQNCLLSYAYENRLYEDITRLIEDPALRHKLARAGEKEAVKWTWERSVLSFEKAIYQIISY